MNDEQSITGDRAVFWVYILKCCDDSFYTGHTENLEQRLHEHQSGSFECYALKRRPVELVYSQDFQTREEALRVEQKTKGWSRAKKAAMINNDWAEVSRLAKKKSLVLSVCAESCRSIEG